MRPSSPCYRTVAVEDRRTGTLINLFYREAGPEDAPVVLLLQGVPTPSCQHRGLINQLSNKYRVIAPDLPGFGFSDAPDAASFDYTFDHLAEMMEGFVDAIGLTRYALYVFDYGAPVGLRLAAMRPSCVTALISQNGNAHKEGLCDGWNSIRAYWLEPSEENRSKLQTFRKAETTNFRYTYGETDPLLISPESYTLDLHFLDQPGNDDAQLDLLGDCQRSIETYVRFHDYFRTHQPPTLAVWGKNDPSFETRLEEVADIVSAFLAGVLDTIRGEPLFGTLDAVSVPIGAQDLFATVRNELSLASNFAHAVSDEPSGLGIHLGRLQAPNEPALDPIAQHAVTVATCRVNPADYGLALSATLAAKLGPAASVDGALMTPSSALPERARVGG